MLNKVLFAAAITLSAPANAAYDWSALDAELAARAGTSGYPSGGALVIEHKGTVVYEKSFGNWKFISGWNTRMVDVYSVSKSVAAFTYLGAQTAGLIPNATLDTKPETYVPWLDNYDQRVANVTFRQLMSNTAGFLEVNPANEPCLGNYTVSMANCVNDVLQGAGGSTNLAASPGAQFRYTGSGWQVMGYAVQQATNTPWEALMQQVFTSPCGIQNDLVYDGSMNPWVAGGVQMNVKAGRVLSQALRTGYCGSTQIVNATLLAEMRSNQLNGASIVASPYGDGRTYGLGLFNSDYANSQFPNVKTHFGAGGSTPFFDKSKRYSGFLMIQGAAGIGFPKGQALFNEILPLIEDQIDLN